MALLELVSERPDWMGALGVALTRPPGVPERSAGEDPWTRPSRDDGERPRRISDDLAWLRQAMDEPERVRPARPCPTPPPWRRGRRRPTRRSGWTACATGACSTPPASSCTTETGYRSTTARPAAPLAEQLGQHPAVAAGGVRLQTQQRGPRPRGPARPRARRAPPAAVASTCAAVAGPGLLDAPGVEVVAQVRRRPERLAVLVGDPVARPAARPSRVLLIPGRRDCGR